MKRREPSLNQPIVNKGNSIISCRGLIAGLAIALLVACPDPADRDSISDEELAPQRPSVPIRSSDENETPEDPQSLVGRNWNSIRPAHCRGETLIRTTEPLRSYVIPSWRGRTLFVYREGGPLFEIMNTEDDRQVDTQRRESNLEILAVVDLGVFDWKTRVISGGIVDDVACWDSQDGGSREPGLVIGVVELRRVSHEVFPPERAWKWNDRQGRFEAVADASKVSC